MDIETNHAYPVDSTEPTEKRKVRQMTTKTSKNTYIIFNPQGACLAEITSKNAKAALRKARLVWSGPIYAMGLGSDPDRAPITGYSR